MWKCPESIPHILAGCSALVQNKYLSRHHSALKVLFFELLHHHKLVDKVMVWYSPVKPKPSYENDEIQAMSDVPVFADHLEVRANRVYARIVEYK